jgi:hypothetical protein
MPQVAFDHNQTITARELIQLNLLNGLSVASCPARNGQFMRSSALSYAASRCREQDVGSHAESSEQPLVPRVQERVLVGEVGPSDHPLEHVVEGGAGLAQPVDGLAEAYARLEVRLEPLQFIYRQDQPRQVGYAPRRQQAVDVLPEEVAVDQVQRQEARRRSAAGSDASHRRSERRVSSTPRTRWDTTRGRSRPSGSTSSPPSKPRTLAKKP